MKRFKFMLFLCTVYISSVAYAQQIPTSQVTEQVFLQQKQEKAILSGLTQQDVDTFLKFVNGVRKLKARNPEQWEKINTLSAQAQARALQDLANLTDAEDIMVSSMRIHLVLQVTNTQMMKQLKERYEIIQSKAQAVKAQLANLPEEQRKAKEREIDLSLNHMKHMMFYPKEGLQIYQSNKEKIDAGIQLLESK